MPKWHIALLPPPPPPRLHPARSPWSWRLASWPSSYELKKILQIGKRRGMKSACARKKCLLGRIGLSERSESHFLCSLAQPACHTEPCHCRRGGVSCLTGSLTDVSRCVIGCRRDTLRRPECCTDTAIGECVTARKNRQYTNRNRREQNIWQPALLSLYARYYYTREKTVRWF